MYVTTGTAQAAAAIASRAPAAKAAADETQAIDFASLLSALGGTGAAQSADALGQLTGLSLQDIQSDLMMNAMKALTEKPQTADSVLARLLQAMQGLSADGAEAQPVQLAEELQKRLRELAEESGGTLAAQQLMLLLSGIAPETPNTEAAAYLTGALGAESTNTALQAVLAAQPQALAQALARMGVGAAQPQAEGESPQAQPAEAAQTVAAAQTAEAAQQSQPQQAAAPQQAAGVQPAAQQSPQVQTQGAETGAQQSPAPAGEAQATAAEFETAVRGVKQQLSDHIVPAAAPPAEAEAQSAEEAKPAAPPEAPQENIDAAAYLQSTALAAPAELPKSEAAEIPAPQIQLAGALKTAAAEGEEKITVRLAPQELGEVTVQLTKTAEGISLTIIAKNPETQALLANQIDALKTSMQPLNVEVASVLTQQQFDLLSQQNQHRRQRQEFTALRGAAYYGDEPLAAGEEAALGALPAGALDAYV